MAKKVGKRIHTEKSEQYMIQFLGTEQGITTTNVDLDVLYPPRSKEAEAEFAKIRANAPVIEDIVIEEEEIIDEPKSEQYVIQFL